MTQGKKIWAGVFSALLALFAAVVVATPAVADEAKPQDSVAGGYTLTYTDAEGTPISGTDYQDSGVGGVTILQSATEAITISPANNGKAQGPITILSDEYVTLDGVDATDASSALIIGGDSSDTTANIILVGNNTVTTSTSATAISVPSTMTTIKFLGSGTLSSTGNSGTALNVATTAAVNVGAATPKNTEDIPEAAYPATPTVTLSSASQSVINNNSTGVITLSVAKDATLSATNTADNTAGPTVNLGTTGSVTVNGTMTVAMTGANSTKAALAVGTAGGSSNSITVGTAATSGKNGTAAVPGTLTVTNAGTSNDADAVTITGAGKVTVNAGSVEIDAVGGSGIYGNTATQLSILGGTTTVTAAAPTKAGSAEQSAIDLQAATLTVANGTGATPASLIASSTGGDSETPTAAVGPAVWVAGATVGTSPTATAEAIEGVLKVTSGMGNGLTAKTAGITLNAGSVDVTAEDGTAITVAAQNQDLAVNGGALIAVGGDADGDYAISLNETGGNLNIQNGVADSTPDEFVGPTVSATVSGKATSAVSPTTAGTMTVTQASDPTTNHGQAPYNYYYVIAKGSPDLDPAVPVTIQSYAGSNVAPNTLDLTSQVLEVSEAPMTGVTPTTIPNSAASMDKAVSASGYMVANTTAAAKLPATANDSGYFYQVVLFPTGFEGINYDVAPKAYAGTPLANAPVKGKPGTNVTSSLGDEFVTIANSAANNVYALGNGASGDTMTLTASSKAMPTTLTNLYGNDLALSSGTIKLSYQVTFLKGAYGNTFQVTPEASKLIGAGGNVYLTVPGEGVLIGNGNPVANTTTTTGKNLLATSLPSMTANGGNLFLSWYNVEDPAADPIVPTTQVPQTQISGYTQNTTYIAEFGTITYTGVTPSPVNLTRGGSATVYATATVKPTVDDLAFSLNNSGLANYENLVQSVSGSAWTLSPSGATTGVSITPSSFTQGADGTWTLAATITAANNATGDTYTANFNPTTRATGTTITGAQVNVIGAQVSIIGNGTVTQQVASNGTVHLTATPGTGDTFLGWYSTSTGTLLGTSTSIDVANNTAVTAKFTGQTPGPVAPTDGAVAVSRLYNPNLEGAHLLTSDQTEIAALTTAGWRDEGVKFWVYGNAGTNNVAVYRLYNPNNHDHLYTTSANEADTLASIGWKKDFGGKPAFWGAVSSNIPVLRVYNSHATANGGVGNHLWTTDANEVQTLTNIYGWTPEGTAWYAVANGPTL